MDSVTTASTVKIIIATLPPMNPTDGLFRPTLRYTKIQIPGGTADIFMVHGRRYGHLNSGVIMRTLPLLSGKRFAAGLEGKRRAS